MYPPALITGFTRLSVVTERWVVPIQATEIQFRSGVVVSAEHTGSIKHLIANPRI